MTVTATPVDPTNKPGVFALALSLQCELYAGKRCPPGTFSPASLPYFNLTHFFYTISDAVGDKAVQMMMGSSPKGDAGASDGYSGGNPRPPGGREWKLRWHVHVHQLSRRLSFPDRFRRLAGRQLSGAGHRQRLRHLRVQQRHDDSCPGCPRCFPATDGAGIQGDGEFLRQSPGRPVRRQWERVPDVGDRAGLGQREHHPGRVATAGVAAGFHRLDLQPRSDQPALVHLHGFYPQPRNCRCAPRRWHPRQEWRPALGAQSGGCRPGCDQG